MTNPDTDKPVMTETKGLCEQCNKNPASHDHHSCPYQIEIYDNPDENHCTCCKACEQSCADCI